MMRFMAAMVAGILIATAICPPVAKATVVEAIFGNGLLILLAITGATWQVCYTIRSSYR